MVRGVKEVREMPSWKIHTKWSRKMGIPDDVAEHTNKVIDAWKLGNSPEDFLRYVCSKQYLARLLRMFEVIHDLRKFKREVLPYFRMRGEIM